MRAPCASPSRPSPRQSPSPASTPHPSSPQWPTRVPSLCPPSRRRAGPSHTHPPCAAHLSAMRAPSRPLPCRPASPPRCPRWLPAPPWSHLGPWTPPPHPAAMGSGAGPNPWLLCVGANPALPAPCLAWGPHGLWVPVSFGAVASCHSLRSGRFSAGFDALWTADPSASTRGRWLLVLLMVSQISAWQDGASWYSVL
uniref:Uncharacterized protein n=1 Tax=Aquila chrysaetos chrysaetos TaxID=223781 RepID=A0A663EUW4_AQUCH